MNWRLHTKQQRKLQLDCTGVYPKTHFEWLKTNLDRASNIVVSVYNDGFRSSLHMVVPDYTIYYAGHVHL